MTNVDAGNKSNRPWWLAAAILFTASWWLPQFPLPGGGPAIVVTDQGSEAPDPVDPPVWPLEIHFFDVGHGQAILIRGDRGAVLVDGGEAGTGGLLVKEIRELGITHLRAVILTDRGEDHVGGLLDVADGLTLDRFYDSHDDDQDTEFSVARSVHRRLLERVREQGAEYHMAQRGDTVDLSTEIQIRFLAPIEDEAAEGDISEAFHRTVLMVEGGAIKLLVAGSMGHSGESLLARLQGDLRANVLHVARHGHKSATGALFLENVQAQLAVLHVGRYNEEGLPHQEVLDRLQAADVRIYRTDRSGTVVLRTDGAKLEIVPQFGTPERADLLADRW